MEHIEKTLKDISILSRSLESLIEINDIVSNYHSITDNTYLLYKFSRNNILSSLESYIEIDKIPYGKKDLVYSIESNKEISKKILNKLKELLDTFIKQIKKVIERNFNINKQIDSLLENIETNILSNNTINFKDLNDHERELYGKIIGYKNIEKDSYYDIVERLDNFYKQINSLELPFLVKNMLIALDKDVKLTKDKSISTDRLYSELNIIGNTLYNEYNNKVSTILSKDNNRFGEDKESYVSDYFGRFRVRVTYTKYDEIKRLTPMIRIDIENDDNIYKPSENILDISKEELRRSINKLRIINNQIKDVNDKIDIAKDLHILRKTISLSFDTDEELTKYIKEETIFVTDVYNSITKLNIAFSLKIKELLLMIIKLNNRVDKK